MILASVLLSFVFDDFLQKSEPPARALCSPGNAGIDPITLESVIRLFGASLHYVCVCIHACIHTYIHTYIHTHTYGP